MENSKSVLEARSLHKQYHLGSHDVNALSGIDFIVEQGEFVAIMGPSGSGKSTLLHLIGGLDQPSEGEVILAGKRLSLLKDRQLTILRRRNVGFVFQFFNLLPTLTAEENILLPILIDGQNPRKFEERLKILLDLVGLTDRRGHRPEQLSGGEQQRVALARALITEPAILLADEPTGNLDRVTGAAIMSLLQRSYNELKQTVIVVTHDPFAATYAKRVIFLKDGCLISELHLTQDMEQAQKVAVIIDKIRQLEV
jgi:putative ABC transport system ATP-binding protein